MLEWMSFIVHHLFVHFRISSSLSFQRKTKRHVFLLLFVLTPVHLDWPSYATGKCYRSPRQLISTMKHWWLYITIHSLTTIKWKTRNLRLNLIYLSFFVQYITPVEILSKKTGNSKNDMKKHRLSAELNWIKLLQTQYPLNLNDQLYKQGNISSVRSNIDVFSLKPDVRWKRR